MTKLHGNGIRKVNEQIFSSGRVPVLTELDDKQIGTLEAGTLRVNPENGDLFLSTRRVKPGALALEI